MDKKTGQQIKVPPGMFFCEGHLNFMLMEQMSYDKRYCIECCQFLEKEAASLNPDRWGNPGWVPKQPETHCNENLGQKNYGYEEMYKHIPQQLRLIEEVANDTAD